MRFSIHTISGWVVRFQQSRLAYIASFLILTLQRSPVVTHLAKLQQMLGQPILHVARISAPVAAFFGGTHAVTGATGVVPAGGSADPAEAVVGESFVWAFRVTGESAHSYSVSGLPAGMELSSQVLSGGVSSIGGVPEEPGEFTVSIVGWEHDNQRGDATPAYVLTLNVAGGEPPTLIAQPQGGTFEAGTNTTLQVGAEGGGLHYRWLRDGEEIANTARTWIDASTERRVLVPGEAVDDAWRTDPGFDDQAWTLGAGGVGYERSGSNYDPYFEIDVEELYNNNTSAMIRIPFELSEADVLRLNEMKLRIQYDDGYAAFLNGNPIAEANAPANLSWDSSATDGHSDADAVIFDEIDLSEHASILKAGTNLLAIQAMNDSSNSSDLLCNVELLGGRNTDQSTLDLSGLTAGDANAYSVEVSNGAGSMASEVAMVQMTGGSQPTGYEAWQAEHWQAGLGLASQEADPDGDGLNNLLEYYYASNPLAADAMPSPSANVVGQQVVLRFPRSEAQDVAATFEISADLQSDSWAALVSDVDGVEIEQAAGETIVKLPAAGIGRFVRLRVSPIN